MAGVGVWLRGILGLQVGLALGLVAADFARSAGPGGLELWRPGAAPPGLTAPPQPGDQRRRFAPGDVPMPEGAGEMPSRLLFERAGETLRLSGEIAVEDAARLFDWWATQESPPARVALHSVGGSVDDALAIGRFLRAAGVGTEVPAGRVCLSACPYILAAGVTRSVGDGAAVGVHQHYHGESAMLPAFLAVEDIQRGQADVLVYLAEMGVDPLVMVPAMSTPPDEIHLLLPHDLARYGLVTEPGG